MHHKNERILKPKIRTAAMLAFFLCLAGLLTAQTVAGPGTDSADVSLKVKAEQKISEYLGVPVSVQDYQLQYTTVRLRGIKIGDKTSPGLPYAEVQELSATCNFMSLISGNLVLEEITISSFSARLTRTASGEISRGKFPVSASSSAPLDADALPFQKIHLTSLEVKLVDEGLKKTFVLRVPALSVGKPAGGKGILVAAKGAVGVSAVGGSVKIPEFPFAAAIHAEQFSPLLASGSVSFGPARVNELQRILEGLIPGSSGEIKCQSGNAEAGLEFSSLKSAPPNTKVWVRLHEVNLKSASSRLQMQQVSGKVSFSGTLKSGLIDGTLDFAKLRGGVGAGKVPVRVESMRCKIDGLGRKTGLIQIGETSLSIMEIPLKVSGTLKPAETPQLRFDIGSTVDLAKLHKSLPSQNQWFRKQTTLAGKCSVAAEIIGSFQEPEVKAKIRLSEGAFTFPAKKIELKKIDTAISVDKETATITHLNAVAADGNLALKGTMKNPGDPVVSISGTLKKASASDVLGILSALFAAIPSDLKLSGTSDIEFGIEGKAKQPQVSGTALLHGAGLEFPLLLRPFTQIQGSILFNNTSLRTSDMRGKWGTSDVRVSGQVKDLALFQTGLSFTVKPLDLSDIASFFIDKKGYRISGSGEADGTIEGPPANLKIEGTARIPTGQIVAPISSTNKSSFSFPYSNLFTRFRFAGGNLAIIDAQANVFGGSLKGNGSIDLRPDPVRYDLQVKGEKLRTEAFLEENTSQKQVVSGPVNGTLQATGDVTGLASWNGKGSMNMTEGKYQAPPVVTPILSALNLKQFSSGELEGASGDFVLKNGIMNTNDLVFLAPIGKVYYRGDVGLDTTLHGDMNIMFSQVAVNQSQGLREISLDGSSVSIPTKVRGTLLEPSFPGFSPGKLLELGLKRKGQKILQDILRGKSNSPDNSKSSGSEKKPVEKELKNLGKNLKKLFKF